MKLYFDIGNTNIKVNFNLKGKEFYMSYETKYPYTVDSFYNLLPKEIKNETIETVMICSVVPKQLSVIEGMVKKYWQIKPTLLAFPLKTGINIKANDPKKIGADIVALAAYVGSITKNGIIVNMGTATTITHIVNNAINGVVIIPGFKTAKDALLENAAKLNDINLRLPKNKVIGNSTEESISIGIIKGHVHMLRGFVKEIDETADLYLSGGNSRQLINILKEFAHIKEATIEGMKVVEKLSE